MRKEDMFIETKLVVRGTGRFPLDMLRYDSCTFYSSVDAAAAEIITYADGEPRVVTLRRFSHEGRAACAARWKSFGWEVVEDYGKGALTQRLGAQPVIAGLGR